MSLRSVPSILYRNSLILSHCNYTVIKRPIHIYSCLSAGQKWRMRQGKSRTGNEYGPLTDLPDWTYTDGRPPVLGKGQLRRKVKQFALSQRIRRLLKEMDTAKAAGGESTEIRTNEEEGSSAEKEDQVNEGEEDQVEEENNSEDGQSEENEIDVRASRTN